MNKTTSAEHFERAKAVLRGEAYSTREHGVRKVLTSVFMFEGSNSWINREAFEFRWVAENRRRPHGYLLELAPGVVWDVLSRMGVSEIRRPTVGLGTDRTVRTLRCLHRETCVLLDDGAVKCWGQGVGDDPGEMGDALEAVLSSSDLVEAAG